eukprot:CAMPEP_0170567060 /NCGR_PEP_ID=MMETSP0211-20121228/80244_1 /TAXON_ID=311385 /ORGANISM="Pseudokeronopsis sp., Strain OXSARD2" /LENGTH=77 /DNA_ID=CAMNT_0010888417 /DNA_START=1077 /DNA_END=1310 /DNA_ORIENTATION=-
MQKQINRASMLQVTKSEQKKLGRKKLHLRNNSTFYKNKGSTGVSPNLRTQDKIYINSPFNFPQNLTASNILNGGGEI